MIETAADFYSDQYNEAIRARLGARSSIALYIEAEDLAAFYSRPKADGAVGRSTYRSTTPGVKRNSRCRRSRRSLADLLHKTRLRLAASVGGGHHVNVHECSGMFPDCWVAPVESAPARRLPLSVDHRMLTRRRWARRQRAYRDPTLDIV